MRETGYKEGDFYKACTIMCQPPVTSAARNVPARTNKHKWGFFPKKCKEQSSSNQSGRGGCCHPRGQRTAVGNRVLAPCSHTRKSAPISQSCPQMQTPGNFSTASFSQRTGQKDLRNEKKAYRVTKEGLDEPNKKNITDHVASPPGWLTDEVYTQSSKRNSRSSSKRLFCFNPFKICE